MIEWSNWPVGQNYLLKRKTHSRLFMKNLFKMEILLKLKKFREQNEKINLGKILKKIDENKKQISILNKNLDEIYGCQSSELEKNIKGNAGGAYHVLIDAIRTRIKNHYKNLENIKKDYDQSRKRLNVVLGEVKALQKMKNAHERSLKKKKDLKREREIEDIINMRGANG